MEIRGLATLITGGSRGLGAALGRVLARRGARVVLIARGARDLDAVVDEIRTAGGEAHAVVADVGDKNAVHPIAGAAAAVIGPVDLLVHNASSLGPTPLPLLLDTACEDLERVLAANLIGPFRLTKAIAGSMALRGRGLVVHVTSDAGVVPYPRWGAYGVSKAALDHLGRIWAEELEDTGVKFLTIDPGEMDTAMHALAMPDADRSALARPEDVAARITAIIASSETIGSGSRIEASAGKPAA
ncbi:MAG TPA: SDR family oxidoreductase [Thermoanaerobaculia bacterium]|nr:SDR family oxidoreductase [Thermoanaerobaculia bacterium]